MKLLSVSGIYHDLNICYFDGHKVYYLKVERQNKIKHFFDKSLFDINSDFNKFLSYFNLSEKEIDAVCVDSSIIFHNKLFSEITDDKLFYKFNDKIFIVDHHYLHALSCEILSDKHYDVSIVIDGQGAEYSWSIYKNDSRIDCSRVLESGSIGFGMSFLGTQLGLKGHVIDLAGKVMGLQTYGKVDLEYLQALSKYNIRNTDSKIFRNIVSKTAQYGMFDISSIDNKLNAARTLHEKAGEIILDLFNEHASSDMNIAYSGGVAQNVIWNTKLKQVYKNLEVLPHVSDEGLSLGGIEFLRKHFNLPKFDFSSFPYMQSDESVEEPSQDTIDQAAEYLAQGKIVAWYQGNGEIGPRALGNRSILMDPRIENGKDVINKVKKREYFRPFGASILSEYAKEYFDLDFENPYMLYVGVTQKDNLKSITHVDGTCRVQTVSKEGSFRSLLQTFNKKTGCPVLLNTSLNISGKPIAGHVVDAIYEYENTGIDVLIVGNTVYKKS